MKCLQWREKGWKSRQTQDHWINRYCFYFLVTALPYHHCLFLTEHLKCLWHLICLLFLWRFTFNTFIYSVSPSLLFFDNFTVIAPLILLLHHFPNSTLNLLYPIKSWIFPKTFPVTKSVVDGTCVLYQKRQTFFYPSSAHIPGVYLPPSLSTTCTITR